MEMQRIATEVLPRITEVKFNESLKPECINPQTPGQRHRAGRPSSARAGGISTHQRALPQPRVESRGNWGIFMTSSGDPAAIVRILNRPTAPWRRVQRPGTRGL